MVYFIKMKHTEKSIASKIRYYRKQDKYLIPNIYLYEWESDVWALNRNNFAIEYEIKTSLLDFQNDAKKIDKHVILESGHLTKYSYKRGNRRKYILGESARQKVPKNKLIDLRTVKTEKRSRPNRFYYVCPKNVIPKKEIPDHAGLIYLDKGMKIIKTAPLLHNIKVGNDVYKQLTMKLYYKWLKSLSK